jgi:glycosyltransferase involved in cell wall biosynthesis
MCQSTQLMFLAWESPWPAHSGAALRSWGLLNELCKAFQVELVLLTRCPLSLEQTALLGSLTQNVTRIPLKDVSYGDRLQATLQIISRRYPYHSAVLESSFLDCPDVRHRIEQFPGAVFTSTGHWGTLVRNQQAPNWVLNQCDADVEFWRVYASQTSSHLVKLAALVNWRLSDRHFRCVYSRVGRIISVCEEDKQLTLALAPHAQIDVIENGVDCSYYVPDRTTGKGSPPRLLFTGTSAARNMAALRQFACDVLPLVQCEVPDVELLVAGNFGAKAQARFSAYRNVRFTGQVDDIRPFFNQSDVFVAPFEETHGSKLKIAEAMAMEMAIVSTPQGIRGFSLVNDESVLIAHNEEQFASHVVALLRDQPRRQSLGAAAREVALSTVDWPVLGKRLVGIIHSVEEEWRAG